jgi:hypothetical protein
MAVCKELEKRRIAELDAMHVRQIEEFERQWGDPDFLITFTKPSPRLIFLRNSERNLAMFQEFDRARRVKAEADMLQKLEEALAKQRAIVAMKSEFHTLKIRQKREMDCLLEYSKQRQARLEQERNVALLPMEQIVHRLSSGLDRPKHVKKKNDLVGDEGRHSRRRVRVHAELKGNPTRALGLAGIPVRKYVKVTTDCGETKNQRRKERSQVG